MTRFDRIALIRKAAEGLRHPSLAPAAPKPRHYDKARTRFQPVVLKRSDGPIRAALPNWRFRVLPR